MKIKINYKNTFIQDIKVGDIVKSFDIETDQIRHNMVSDTILPIVEKKRQCKIVCTDGAKIITSIIHPMCYWNQDESKWDYKLSQYLVIGDKVKTETGVTFIQSVEIGLDEDEQFYDLTVERDNNFFAGIEADKMIVVHNSSTVHIPWWHQEIEDILVLKNNKGTDDNRVRHMDYSICFSKLFFQRVLEGKDVALFSPHDVKDMQLVFGRNDEFDKLYLKYEKDKTVSKKWVKAQDLMTQFVTERIGTARIYAFFADNANTNSPFKELLEQSNLCLSGDTEICSVQINGQLIKRIRIDEFVDIWTQNPNQDYKILSKNLETNELEWKQIEKAWLTAKDQELYLIKDYESGKTIKCTGNHLIWTKNRGWVEAQNLDGNDDLDIIKDNARTKLVAYLRKIIINKISERSDVFDITVADNHNFYANGILVHNCQEVILPVKEMDSIYDIDNSVKTEHLSEGEVALCVLAGHNLGKIKNKEELYECSEYMVRICDFVISHQEYPINAAKKMLKRRSIGCGVVNFAYWLAKNDLKYSDPKSLVKVDELFEHIQFSLLEASCKLAQEQGPCEWFHKTTYSDGILPIDRYNKNVDKLVQRPIECDWEGLRTRIKTYGLRNSVLSCLFPAESNSVVQNATQGIDPMRTLVTSRKSKAGIVKMVAPEATKLKNKYELAFDMPDNIGYTNICAVMQKWIDQSISANHFYKWTPEGTSVTSVIKDVLYSYKMGLKTLYYANNDDKRDEETPEEENGCAGGACSL